MTERCALPAAVCALLLMASSAHARPREKDLLAQFDAGKTEDRIRLAPAVGRLKDKKAVDSLLLALDVKRASPRESAAVVDALGEAGDARAVVELGSAWDYLKSMSLQMGELPAGLQVLRVKILDALSRCGGPQAVAILSEAINDKDPRTLQAAARGLGRLQVKDAVTALQQLAGAGGDVTQTVFEAMADIGDKRAVSSLEQGLKSADRFTEIEAAYALLKMGRKEMKARLESMLKTDPGQQKAGILAAYYLVKLDHVSGLEYLDETLKKPDAGFAVLAADALGKSENPRAVLPLVEAAGSNDPDVRLSVARGFGRLGGTRAVAGLKKLRLDGNPGVRAAADTALIALGELE